MIYIARKDDITMAAGGPMGSPTIVLATWYCSSLDIAKSVCIRDQGHSFSWFPHSSGCCWSSPDFGAYQYRISAQKLVGSSPKPPHDVLNILTTALNEYIEGLLEDPRSIAEDAPRHIERVRATAEWLGINFEQLLNGHSSRSAVARLRALENEEEVEL